MRFPKNGGGTPQSFILINRIFRYKLSILGILHLWKPPFMRRAHTICRNSIGFRLGAVCFQPTGSLLSRVEMKPCLLVLSMYIYIYVCVCVIYIHIYGLFSDYQ